MWVEVWVEIRGIEVGKKDVEVSRPVHRLSAKTVEKTKEPGDYCDGGGLYLQVSPTQSKSWIFRYKRHGKSHWMGLGSAQDVSLAEARTKAQDMRR